MKEYTVRITTVFTKDVKIIANSVKEAEQMIDQFVFSGEIDGTDTLDINTSVKTVSVTFTLNTK